MREYSFSEAKKKKWLKTVACMYYSELKKKKVSIE